ncbi:protein MIS12 homolog isoform X2 [Lingula anatina]|nr:protein MIS12 homolog isoform X2 [Lingula anatina]|eukprot:XP_013406508.1 protein MIS12 homolog isoform X2 [Lingula anatina]
MSDSSSATIADSTLKDSQSSSQMYQSSLAMTEKVLGEQEYETQFFGFTPKSFTDGVYNAVNEYLTDCLEVVEKYIIQEFSAVIPAETVRECTQQLLPVFVKTFDKAFDKLENYLLCNIFHIPNNVLLPEDKPQEFQYTELEQEEIDRDLETLRQKIRNAKYVNACLEQELKDIATVQEQYDKMLTLLERLEKTTMSAGVPDLKESLVFTCDKVRALNIRIQELKPLSPPRFKLHHDDTSMSKMNKRLRKS